MEFILIFFFEYEIERNEIEKHINKENKKWVFKNFYKMKLTEKHKIDITEAFNKMNSKEDFLNLLNYAKKLVYSEKAYDIKLKQINYYISKGSINKRYKQFTIKKKSGQDRIINAPVKGLKAIQKCINLILQIVYEKHQHKAANGFVPDKSIVDNARVHEGSIYVYNIDLKDFFPSIDQARVWKRLQMEPFNLKGKSKVEADKNSTTPSFKLFAGIDSCGSLKLNNMISSLCCSEMEVERLNENNEWIKIKKNVLPQGAPTSPTLTNIICQQLDFYLSAVAKRFGLKYSRYADDITFSSMHNVFQKEGNFLKELNRIITAQNFTIKESKTRLQKQGYKQEVTGLIVNEKVNVPQRYIKQLRLYLHRWEKLGYEKANEMFFVQYNKDKGYTKSGTPNMANVIAGKLCYLKMVKGGENDMYKKLKGRLDVLESKIPLIYKNQNDIKIHPSNQLNEVMNVWEKEGIQKAIKLKKI